MNQRTAKWILFAAMVCTVPLPYFMFVSAGLLPLSAVIRLGFTGVWGFKLFNSVHLLIFGPLLYFVAVFLTRRLFSLAPPGRTLGVAAALLLVLGISLLPIYGLGHNDHVPVNLYRLFQPGRLV
jgi:hypothetical protein